MLCKFLLYSKINQVYTYVCVCVLSCSVMSDSMQFYGLQSTRLLCPWDSPGRSTGVGCRFLL